jgi:hypothetical protein
MSTQKRGIGAKNWVVTKYWLEYYAAGACTLCGDSGLINTTGVTAGAGVKVGRVNYCICPNGQVMRKAAGGAAP